MSAAVEKDSDNASKINIALAQCVAKGLKAMDTEQQLEVVSYPCPLFTMVMSHIYCS